MVVSVSVYDAALHMVAEEVQYSQALCLEVDRLNKYRLDCGNWFVLEPRLLQDHSPRDLDSGLLAGSY